MKKKFVLTLALVLMVAATLVAAPLEIGGNFKAGYAVTLKSGANGIASLGKKELSLGSLSVSGDFWKVAFADVAFNAGDNKMNATATIYIDKALAAQGMDMGELSLEMVIGNKGNLGDLSVYSNKRDELQGLKMASGFTGAYATSMTVGYGDLVHVMVGVDPISFFDGVGNVVGKPALAKNNALVLSAKSTPVDGVSVALGYANVSRLIDGATNTFATTATNYSVDGALSASVNVDVAALAGLDFGLGVSAYDLYNFEKKENNLYLELNGSYADFSAWTEYRIRDKRNDMMLKVSYAGIENLGLSAQLELDDITDKVSAKEIAIGAGMTYNFGGVTYGFEGKYKVEDKSFTMSPTVKIVF